MSNSVVTLIVIVGVIIALAWASNVNDEMRQSKALRQAMLEAERHKQEKKERKKFIKAIEKAQRDRKELTDKNEQGPKSTPNGTAGFWY